MLTCDCATVLTDQAGTITNGSQQKVLGLAITAALTGTLTVTGVNNIDGSPAAWTYPPGTTGAYLPPGNSGGIANRLTYTLSSASDTGKVFVAWRAL